MDTKSLTVRVPLAQLEQLNALAASTRRSKSDLTSEALGAYLAVQEWQVAAIQAAIDASMRAPSRLHIRK